MKSKVIVSILAVVALGLVVGLFMTRKTISEQSTHIGILSNTVVETHTKLDDLTQVHNTTIADLDKRNAEFLSLTNSYTDALGTLAKTEKELKTTEDSLKLTKDEVAARDAKITSLEAQNKELDTKSAELSTALTNLTTKIEATQQKLASAEGDKAFLQKELSRLMAEKAELERQLNDLAFLKKQVSQLKAELSISKRLEWIRQGLFSPGEQKGASQLMQKTAPSTTKSNAYDLNVEIHSDGSTTILPPLTNAPATK
jgi:chromosome segregation ATPase